MVPESASLKAHTFNQGGAMEKLEQFLEESPIAIRVTLPTKIIVHELKLSYAVVKGIMESAAFAPSNGKVCELEVGGRRIARGRIVRRRGEYFFKVGEMAKGGAQ
jgi:hypothetical protein